MSEKKTIEYLPKWEEWVISHRIILLFFAVMSLLIGFLFIEVDAAIAFTIFLISLCCFILAIYGYTWHVEYDLAVLLIKMEVERHPDQYDCWKVNLSIHRN